MKKRLSFLVAVTLLGNVLRFRPKTRRASVGSTSAVPSAGHPSEGQWRTYPASADQARNAAPQQETRPPQNHENQQTPPPNHPTDRPQERPPQQTTNRPPANGQQVENVRPHVENNQWIGHDQNDARYHMDHPYQHGHFEHFGPQYRYSVQRIDRDHHRFWFPGGFYWQIAAWDWTIASSWCWTCGDTFVVYDDPDHPGWYLVYDTQTGEYVHAEYMGG